MKVFQIEGGFCHWDATDVVSSVGDAAQKFAPDMVFVEAPDYVFEGWGFDDTLEGDARFVQPVPPEGWLYDENSGTFYREDDIKPSDVKKSPEQLAHENAELKKSIAELEEMLTETQLALCDVFETMLSGGV